MREDLGEVEAEDLDHEPLEDGVRRHEERAEEDQERGGEQHAARHGERLPLPSPAQRLAPLYVGHADGHRACRGEGAGESPTDDVIRDAGAPEAPAASAPHGQGERDQDRQRDRGRPPRENRAGRARRRRRRRRRPATSPLLRYQRAPTLRARQRGRQVAVTQMRKLTPHGVARSSRSPRPPSTNATPRTPSPSLVLSPTEDTSRP